MARKTAGQKAVQKQVEERLTTDTPLTVDATAVQSGGSRGSSRQLLEQHPSLQGLTASMSEAGLQGGTVTTNSGLAVRVSRNKGGGAYNPQSPEMGNPKAPPLQETGGTPMLRTQVGDPHGADVAKKIAGEAERMRADLGVKAVSHTVVGGLAAINAVPESSRTDVSPGVRSRVAGLDNVRFAQSTAGQRPTDMQGLNPLDTGRAARRAGVSVRPVFESSHDMVAHGLGYTEAVQNQMLQVARGRVAERHRANPQGQTPAQREAAAQGMVQEHIDTAIRGSKNLGTSEGERGLMSVIENKEGMGIEQVGPRGSAGTGAGPGRRELGNSPTSTPTQRAARSMRSNLENAVSSGRTQGISEHIDSVARDHEAVMRREAAARRRAAPAPQDRNTMGQGSGAAQNESRARGQAQFVVSNHPANERTQAQLEGIAGELANQGNQKEADRVRNIIADRARKRPGVGITPEYGKKASVVIRTPYQGEPTPPPAKSNIANPNPPATANKPKTVPTNRAPVQRPARRPVGGGTRESDLRAARAAARGGK